jgi:FtsZ-binding cell division protein ZapB
VSTVAVGSVAARELAGRTALQGRIARLEDENAALRQQQQRLEAERERLRVENQRLRAERERLQQSNQRLRGEVEALPRAAKRQAAPFSKGDPTPNPKRAGRRPGAAYGTRAHRRPPEHVDQVVAVGLPAGKIARLFAQLGLRITAGGVTQAVARVARACQPTYQTLAEGVRASPVVAPDEIGWRVGGIRAWLWAFVGAQVTVYRIAQGRGYQDAAAVLGEGYAGVLERDGWAPYRRFGNATHQTCLAHLLRRCRELVADADRGQAKTPHAVRRVLEHALALREAHNAGTLDAATLAAEAERLGAQIDKLVAGATRYPPNRRLLDHLARERKHLFTFLRIPGVEATNWRAEHAIRPAVVCRKVWGGNRTWAGATTWQTLASVLRTASQQGRDPIELLTRLLQVPVPIVADLAIPGP